MSKQLRKILVSILIGALVLGVSGCGAKNKAADAVDAYLKSVQEDPMSLTVQLCSGPENPYWKAIEELLSEFEYTIVSEGEEYKDAGIGKTAKKVTVDLKGYNIGAYMQMFMENLQTDRLNRFAAKDMSFGDLQHMSDKEIEEFFAELDLEFFNETMEQCHSNGKTWSKTVEILTYLDDKTNEWTVYTLKQYDILDSITNGLYSYLKDSSGVEPNGDTPVYSYDPGNGS